MKSVEELLHIFEREEAGHVKASRTIRRYYDFDEDDDDAPRKGRRTQYPEYDNEYEDYIPRREKRREPRYDRMKRN